MRGGSVLTFMIARVSCKSSSQAANSSSSASIGTTHCVRSPLVAAAKVRKLVLRALNSSGKWTPVSDTLSGEATVGRKLLTPSLSASACPDRGRRGGV